MQDMEEPATVVRVVASRRFGSHWRLSVEAWLFLRAPRESILYDLRNDDFVRTEMVYYF